VLVLLIDKEKDRMHNEEIQALTLRIWKANNSRMDFTVARAVCKAAYTLHRRVVTWQQVMDWCREQPGVIDASPT
jgi:hypothetical protein